MKKYNMLTDSEGRSLFFFALPMILGNLFQQFYSTADSIIVGQFVGEKALAAVGASYALTTVFIMIAIGGGIGASVITSQYLGAALYQRMKTSVNTALLSFLAVSVLLGGIGLIFSRSILISLNTPDNVLAEAVLYLKIYFTGLPFLFMYNILSSIFNALGNSKTPLYLLIFSSLLNIVMDLVLVGGFGLGVAGAAAATVFAQGLSAVISICLLLRTLKSYDNQEGEKALFDVQMFGNMVKVAIPSMVQQSIVSIGMLLVQSVVNGFGSSVLAGYTAGMRIESICVVPMIASGNAVSTFTAQNLGAGQVERVKKGYLAAVKMVAAFAVIICLSLTFFHEYIIKSFLETGSEAAAFETGNSYLTFIAFFFVFLGLKAITDGVLRGAGDVVVFTLANLINLGIRVAAAFTLAPLIGVQGVWFAVPMGWASNYLISLVRYLSGKWSRKKLIKAEQ
ncbi:MAG: MATE family efflux transporter [Lachnospiraceae bacterium]|jgi:putative MATE family efflux protein|nr:MATE efflux family protein [Lachnospiraceae bacterium 10-1]MCX4352648.1 MATE family efflux transporter [Lachnospiraceae bacterium]